MRDPPKIELCRNLVTLVPPTIALALTGRSRSCSTLRRQMLEAAQVITSTAFAHDRVLRLLRTVARPAVIELPEHHQVQRTEGGCPQVVTSDAISVRARPGERQFLVSASSLARDISDCSHYVLSACYCPLTRHLEPRGGRIASPSFRYAAAQPVSGDHQLGRTAFAVRNERARERTPQFAWMRPC